MKLLAGSSSINQQGRIHAPVIAALNLMIRIIETIIILFLALPSLARADDVLIMYSYGRKGPLQYSVPREKAARLQHWKTTKTEPPLKMEAAVKSAETWFHNLYPDVKGWQPISISLSSSNRKDENYVWYYVIMLQPLDTVAYKTIEDTVMILMDGSVVEPKPKEK